MARSSRLARRVVPVVVASMLFLGLATGPAGALLAEHQVLVRFQQGANADAALSQVGARAIGSVYGMDVLIVRGRAASAEALASRIDALAAVDYAEPDGTYHITLDNPSDPRFGDQWAHRVIRSVEGWTAYPGSYTSSGGPTIAIADTGINRNHPDLSSKIDTANSSCFLGLLLCLLGAEDDNGHGTHVAGIAAAATNNGTGVAGVAINARIMALKVCTAAGTCSFSALASAINWARDRGAKVLNMSLGGTSGSQTLATALQNAYAAGMILVAAAGNDGNSTTNYPAAYPEVISVASTTSSDTRSSFSNANATVELAAPGSSILSTYLNGGYATLSGTSMASPHVAGLGALLFGQNPGWSNTQVRNRMNSCSDDLGAPGRDDAFGNGRINLARALGSC